VAAPRVVGRLTGNRTQHETNRRARIVRGRRSGGMRNQWRTRRGRSTRCGYFARVERGQGVIGVQVWMRSPRAANYKVPVAAGGRNVAPDLGFLSLPRS